MTLPSISKIDLKGKRVFLRADLDVPLADGVIGDDTRLRAGLPTIKYLLDQKATVIVAGHLGRPNGIDKQLSLESVAQWLAERLRSAYHSNDTYHCSARTIGDFSGWMLSDKLYVLENLRFYEGEESNDSEFARKLAGLADMYVNDAFTVIHRAHASVVGIAKLLPHYAGLNLQKEVEVLGDVLENPKRPLVIIIGGAKIETKLPLISKMAQFADYVVVGGKLSFGIQNSENRKLVIADLNADGTDITEESVGRFSEIINRAAMIVWNGPLGKLEVKSEKLEVNDTERGTREVAEAIVQSGAYKIVGGGDTIDYLKRLGILGKFDFVSMGGGAMLAFLSGEKLPGLEALQL